VPSPDHPGYVVVGTADGGNEILLAKLADRAPTRPTLYSIDHDQSSARPRERGSLSELLVHLNPSTPELEALLQRGFPTRWPTGAVPPPRPSSDGVHVRAIALAHAMAARAAADWPGVALALRGTRWFDEEMSAPEAGAFAAVVSALATYQAETGARLADCEDLLREAILGCETHPTVHAIAPHLRWR
jgi:hypothetical protein